MPAQTGAFGGALLRTLSTVFNCGHLPEVYTHAKSHQRATSSLPTEGSATELKSAIMGWALILPKSAKDKLHLPISAHGEYLGSFRPR